LCGRPEGLALRKGLQISLSVVSRAKVGVTLLQAAHQFLQQPGLARAGTAPQRDDFVRRTQDELQRLPLFGGQSLTASKAGMQRPAAAQSLVDQRNQALFLAQRVLGGEVFADHDELGAPVQLGFQNWEVHRAASELESLREQIRPVHDAVAFKEVVASVVNGCFGSFGVHCPSSRAPPLAARAWR
jgi:hypothetical protein